MDNQSVTGGGPVGPVGPTAPPNPCRYVLVFNGLHCCFLDGSKERYIHSFTNWCLELRWRRSYFEAKILTIIGNFNMLSKTKWTVAKAKIRKCLWFGILFTPLYKYVLTSTYCANAITGEMFASTLFITGSNCLQRLKVRPNRRVRKRCRKYVKPFS